MADGSITISTELDNKKLEKQLEQAKRKIASLEDQIAMKKNQRMALLDQAEKLIPTLEAAKAKLYQLQTSGAKPAQIQAQTEFKNGLQAQWDRVMNSADKYERDIVSATVELDRQKVKAGGLVQEINAAGKGSKRMAEATERAKESMDRFKARLSAVVRSALVFVVITKALASLREWIGKVVKANPEATAAIARLKGALLTLAQPLVEIVIPAFTTFVNVLANVATGIAQLMSEIFGKTVHETSKAAKSLYEETEALDKTGSAAEKASKSLTTFDEINQIGQTGGGSDASTSSTISPRFDADSNSNWLKARLGESAEMVTAGILLGGLALVAIGAGLGNLSAVIAGLLLIGTGVAVAENSGVLANWTETLGFDKVQETIALGLLLGGLALVAIGAGIGNLGLIIAGIGLLGTGVVIGKESGTFKDWREALKLSEVNDWVTAGLLLGGIGLTVIGICIGNIPMLVAGLGLLNTGIGVGTEEGIFKKWWAVLMLPQVSTWVTTALLLGGIGLAVFGICTGNILMVLGGLAMLGAGVAFGSTSGTFQKWWDALMLPQVAGWVTTALLLGGIGLLVIGIATGNLPMLIAGLAMLGGAVTFGITSGTFSRWIEDIKTGLQSGWGEIKTWWQESVAPKLTKDYWADKFSGIKEGLTEKIKDAVNAAIDLFNWFIKWINAKLTFTWDGLTIAGKEIIPSGSFQLFSIPQIPRLATGAVIPPNREFLAVLGDQKSGNNIEAPLSTIEQALQNVWNRNGGSHKSVTVIMECDRREFGRVVYDLNSEETQRVGVSFAP